MGLMASYNMVCKQKSPLFYDNVELIRLNSPWFTPNELVDVFNTISKPKFLDINLKIRTKAKRFDHNADELLKLSGKYNVEWVAISNVEDPAVYAYIRKLLGNDKTRICAKVETLKGVKNINSLIKAFDGIMVDVEDLASEIGWDKASKEQKRIHLLCDKFHKDHFRLSGVIFDHVSFKKVVYTYGAFDLLHPGHVRLLEKAKSFGDILVVGIVGDNAIKKLKGKDRPNQPLEDRMSIVGSLKCVDQVMVQKDYDPVPNMEKLKPNILVKGNDWAYIPGEEWIKKHGGVLIKPQYSASWSTSAMVKKIKATTHKQ
jgi:rfaE bifunctional protein nucleotidyltransferase chain/domain